MFFSFTLSFSINIYLSRKYLTRTHFLPSPLQTKASFVVQFVYKERRDNDQGNCIRKIEFRSFLLKSSHITIVSHSSNLIYLQHCIFPPYITYFVATVHIHFPQFLTPCSSFSLCLYFSSLPFSFSFFCTTLPSFPRCPLAFPVSLLHFIPSYSYPSLTALSLPPCHPLALPSSASHSLPLSHLPVISSDSVKP